ncbi:hypothetical protein LCGC14_1264110 [marine sediment metagenome]|uniref:Uncharacterized protein n=1 Tax=marine sediment metagenome TaxID=412755 RepID=A0A0F9NGQ2_9ZZZZ
MVDRNLNETFRSAKYVTREGIEVYIPPSGFDWRSIQSFPAVIDPYGESTTQEFPLGTRLGYGEQVFRYTLCGGTGIEVGALCQAVVPLAGHIAEALGINAIGDTTVSFTPNTATTDDVTANELQDGYFFVYDDTGEGQKMRILSHPAITGGAAGVITLIDPFRLAKGLAHKKEQRRREDILMLSDCPQCLKPSLFYDKIHDGYECLNIVCLYTLAGESVGH